MYLNAGAWCIKNTSRYICNKLAIGLRKNADGVTLVTEVDANLSRRSFPGEGGGCGRERRVTVGRPARDRCRWFDRIPAMAFGRPVAFDHRRSIAIQSFNAALEYQQQGGVKPRAVQGAGARRFGWLVSWLCERAPRVDPGGRHRMAWARRAKRLGLRRLDAAFS